MYSTIQGDTYLNRPPLPKYITEADRLAHICVNSQKLALGVWLSNWIMDFSTQHLPSYFVVWGWRVAEKGGN